MTKKTKIAALFFVAWILAAAFVVPVEGKKVKQSLKVEKSKSADAKTGAKNEMKGRKLTIREDGTVMMGEEPADWFAADAVRFSGYDKGVNATKESVLLSNGTGAMIVGFSVRIIYEDMEGRMLHSRVLTWKCRVPGGETRKIDFTSWDTQKSYYYHLSSEPRKAAAPYRIELTPLAYWIE